jgi:RNA polymerase sigma-70 factor (ECF subfamily)
MTTPARQHTVVAAAVESLRPEHRQILLKTYFQGHSASEAAHALGLPLPLVKRRIYEAMQQLRQTLAQEGLPRRATVDRGRLAA